MGHFNTIWQGDANAMTLRAFDQLATPPWVVNVTGPEQLSIRAVGEKFVRLFGKPARFAGTESATAFLSNARVGLERLCSPLQKETAVDYVSTSTVSLIRTWQETDDQVGRSIQC